MGIRSDDDHEFAHPSPVTFTMRCENCRNASTHPLANSAGAVSVINLDEAVRLLKHYAKHHAKCVAR